MTARVIDLGTERSLPDPDRPGGVSWPIRRRRLAFGIAGTVLLALGASAAPDLPALRGPAIVRSAIADRAVVLADRVYLVSAGAGARTLASFSLPSGHHLWTSPFQADGQLSRVLRVGGTVVVFTYEPHLGRGRVYGFDQNTGSLLWQSDAWTVDAVDDGSVLLVRRGLVGAPPWTASEVVSLDGRTGRPRWSAAVPATARLERVADAAVAAGGPRESLSPVPGGLRWAVVTPSRTNVAHVIDLHTGAVAARGPVVPDGATLLDLQAVGGVLLARYAVPGGRPHRLAAYTADRLSLQWVIRAPSDREFYPADCGPMVCIGADGAITALDLRSGAVVWRAPYREIYGAGPRLFARGRDGQLTVLAPETGRSVRVLAGWQVLGPIGGDGSRHLVARSAPGTSRIWVGVLDAAAAAVRTLGSASGVLSTTCRLGAGSVVCELIGGGVGVWAIRV